jgi:uncharacterized membrane protein YfcA
VTAGLTPEFLVLAPLIALLAYTAYGLTGFGSTIIAVPLLAQIVPIKFAVPLMLLLDVVFGMFTGFRFRKQAQYSEVMTLLPFILVGMAAGVVLLVTLNERVLLGALGLFALGYGIYCLLQPRTSARMARGWAAPIGTVGGAFSAMFGSGGVLYIVYLAGRISDKSQLRATIVTVLVISGLPRLCMFGYTGLLAQSGLFAAWLLLLPVGVLGFWLGNRLHHILPGPRVLRLIYGLLIMSGVSLLLRVALA